MSYSHSVPPKRTIILRGIDLYSSQDESTSSESERESSQNSIGEDAHPCEGSLFMIRSLFNNQPSVSHITHR